MPCVGQYPEWKASNPRTQVDITSRRSFQSDSYSALARTGATSACGKSNGAGVTKHFPLPLRGLYCARRAFAVDRGATYESAIDEIERQRLEDSDFGHGRTGRDTAFWLTPWRRFGLDCRDQFRR